MNTFSAASNGSAVSFFGAYSPLMKREPSLCFPPNGLLKNNPFDILSQAKTLGENGTLPLISRHN